MPQVKVSKVLNLECRTPTGTSFSGDRFGGAVQNHRNQSNNSCSAALSCLLRTGCTSLGMEDQAVKQITTLLTMCFH
ncbi:unnamed protein product [Arctogadus glacialis]